MAQVRDVPVLFEGQEIQGVSGEVHLVNGVWLPTQHHISDLLPQIKQAIRDIIGVLQYGDYIGVRRITENNIEYGLFNRYQLGDDEEGILNQLGNGAGAEVNENGNTVMKGGKKRKTTKQKSRKSSKKTKKSKRTRRR